jgi:copper(I)-binding protein
MKRVYRLTIQYSFFAALLLCMQVSAAELEVEDAWIAEAPPGARSHAAYMVLKNNSPNDVTILSIRTGAYDLAEIHETVRDGDMTRMQKLAEVVIAAGGTLNLEPGGKHIMLMGPQQQYQAGDRFGISLVYNDDTGQDVQLEVRSAAANKHHHHH